MKVLKEGHLYELDMFEEDSNNLENQKIQFIEKIPQTMLAKDGITEVPTGILMTLNNGTTNEEILEMLINRMNYLQSKFPCRENAIVITKLEESLMWLNKRTLDRVKRSVEGKHIA